METNIPYTILVVDDEEDIQEILRFNLENEGFIVNTAFSAEEALVKLNPEYDLILLDVMMEGISGFRMAEQVRKSGNHVPIIFLTAKNTENDMLTGFSLGGDDYISKPFSIKEVIVRVKNVLKRVGKINQYKLKNSVIQIDKIFINLDSKETTVDGEQLELTKKEFEILVLFISNQNKLFSRQEVLHKIWGEKEYVLERTVDVHIARLRKKIGKYGDYIINKTGYGYGFFV